MNARDILKYGQATFLGSIDGFPESEWDTPEVCGVWSAKDVVAHLSSYEQVLADVLSSFVENGPTPRLDRYLSQGREFNDLQVEARRGMSLAEVLEEFQAAHTRTLELITQVPLETLRHPGTLPWYGEEYALDDYIVYGYYGHKREHSAQIAAFLDVVARRAAKPEVSRV